MEYKELRFGPLYEGIKGVKMKYLEQSKKVHNKFLGSCLEWGKNGEESCFEWGTSDQEIKECYRPSARSSSLV